MNTGMRPKLDLKGQFIEADPNGSCLVAIAVERIPSDGILRARGILTAAKRLFIERGYQPLMHELCIPDDDFEPTIAISEEELTVVLKFAEFEIDADMFDTDVALVKSRLEMS
jgi:hypothetical protein